MRVPGPNLADNPANWFAVRSVEDSEAQDEVDAGLAGAKITAVVSLWNVIGSLDLARSQETLGGAGEIRACGERSQACSSSNQQLTACGFDDS